METKEEETVAETAGERKVAEAAGERKIRKKTMGRQKIEIKPIKCRDARYVCFSKRRKGLFKKATELCVLTGAQVAIITFSPTPAGKPSSEPGGKPYPFGHPSIDAVLDRFLDPESYSHVAPAVEAAAAATQTAVLREYRGEEERLEKALEEEAQRRSALDAAVRATGAWTTSDDNVRRAGMPELVAMLAALERVRDEAAAVERAYEEAMMMQQCAATDAIGAFQFQYSGAGVFAGGAGGISYQEDMDLQMMPMGGNVSHALPHDLPPQPPFNYGGAEHNHIAGYGYDLGDGSGHGAAAMEGYYGPTTTCNFFG